MTTTTVKKARWSAHSLYKRIKDRMLTERTRLEASLSAIRLVNQVEIESLLTTDLVFYAGIVGDLELCARVYAWEGLIGLMDGDENTLNYLYQATCYEVAAHRLLFAFYLYPSKTVVNQTSFNNFALALARAVAIGCWQEAEELAKILGAGLSNTRIYRDERDPTYEYKHSYFAGTNATCVAPFILQLYSQARGTQFPLDHLDFNPLASMEAYEPLLRLWQTKDMDALQQVLLPACDLHLHRSKPLTKSTNPEFWDLTDMLYPAEILMLLRLREKAGLITPTFDHPLLNTPAGRLYPVRSVPHDSDLDRALDNGLRAVAFIRSIEEHEKGR